MAYKFNTELDLSPRSQKKYFISSSHRRTSKDKSRWLINIESEVQCFIESDIKEWYEETIIWGIVKDGHDLLILGENPKKEGLKIAKFVDKEGNNLWHGYPADYVRNFQDRPGIKVLQKWREANHIEKHHIVKIRQGKECNL